MQRTILIVDDNPNMLQVMRMTLEDANHHVLIASSGDAALALVQNPDLDLILTDLKMPGLSGEAFIALVREQRPEIPIIVVTAFGSIRSAIECVKVGATDYLTKPFEPEALQFTVNSALRLLDLTRKNSRLEAVIHAVQPYRRLVGQSQAMIRLREQIAQVAPYCSNVLITGESGTGKEAVARTIHEEGSRSDQPWVAVNCSAIPHELMESELFGHVRGAFTGATRSRMGFLEQADGGTLFLDEIGDMELSLQAKLLRVLQEREFSPLGGGLLRRVDVQVIAATNHDLKQRVREGLFREDLMYRLDVYPIRVPPLREREGDALLLAEFFLAELRAKMDKRILRFDPEAEEAMAHYSWPGNVRELRNAVERALLSCKGESITLMDLPNRILAQSPTPNRENGPTLGSLGGQDLESWLEQAERRLIKEALAQSNGVQAQAARLLGISDRSIWHRLKKLGIQVSRTAQQKGG
ncbi:MAG: sigma-54-dependent Fis family transcriptional regulator [Magnetococcales bacterium]|nr:sigma-54-dependent Fis family transcriptional regulator [Magnetococcales bacterium]